MSQILREFLKILLTSPSLQMKNKIINKKTKTICMLTAMGSKVLGLPMDESLVCIY